MTISTLKNHRILNLREFFHSENIGFLHNMLTSPYCVTRPQWVNTTSHRFLANIQELKIANLLQTVLALNKSTCNLTVSLK